MGTRRRSMLAIGATVMFTAGAVGGIAWASDGNTRLRTDLAGTEEVPVTDADGTGRATLQIDAEAGQLCFTVRYDDNTGTPNRGHIHAAATGVNGGIVVPLFELVDVPLDPDNDDIEDGKLTKCVTADPALLADIAANPANYYVNLHNSRFPAGAIRGQLD